ncbi:hypothetical protein CPB83DRAFT_845045 [Crepidotus variabilis]|uniref:Uncharacterized protein n=1 Tax=Crepidotus variabilis TaxID=179855 RepID=A0A9P6EQA6_9AGAR|nr:hypothetical protein CPB83DRAFT_845045 [Crepidotus variabilis]
MTKSLVSLFAAIALVNAQGGFVPLIDKKFTWDNIPYKVDTDVGLVRGDQVGYNRCNSSTEGPTSLCQTAIINSLDDFCLWAPPEAGKTVGEIEGEMIAWCSQPGHGTRIFPDGAITGVQFTKTPDYVQVVGFMNQTKINMVAGDPGGEMDPHGADQRGNPIGGILFTNAWTGTYVQANEYHNFMGSNQFCLKACDPTKGHAADYCQHIYDTQGCGFNAPSNAKDGVFESCAGDSQAFPGAGVAVPASSQCSTFASTAIYGAGATTTAAIPGASTISFSTTPRPKPTASSSAQSSGSASGSKSSTAPSASSTSGAMLSKGSVTIAAFLISVFAMFTLL